MSADLIVRWLGRQPYEPAFREYLVRQLAVPASRIVELRRRMTALGIDPATTDPTG